MAADGHPRPAGMAALREGMKVNDPVTGNTIEALHMVTIRGRFVYEGQEYVVVKDAALRDPKIFTRDAFDRASVSNGIVVMESGEGTFKEHPPEADPAVAGEKIHGDHTDTSGSPEEQNRQRDRWQRFKVDKQGRITPVVDGHVDLVDGQALARLNPKTGDIEVDGTPQFSTQDKVRTAIKQWAKKNDATRIGVSATEAPPAEAQARAAERAKSQEAFADEIDRSWIARKAIDLWRTTKGRSAADKAEATRIYNEALDRRRQPGYYELAANVKAMEAEGRAAPVSTAGRQCTGDCVAFSVSNASNGRFNLGAVKDVLNFKLHISPDHGLTPPEKVELLKELAGKDGVKSYSPAEFLKILETRRPPPAGMISIDAGKELHAVVWRGVTDPIGPGGKAYAIIEDSNLPGSNLLIPLDEFAQVLSTNDVWTFEPPQPSGQ